MEEAAYRSIKEKCEIALAEYYPAGIPAPASARLTAELEHLKNSSPETLDDFVLYSELAEAAKRGSFEICLGGTTAGSIIVFLLGNRRINPLPAHYYCRKCGYFEMTEEVTFGLDLPEKICPDCGAQLFLDGFSLPIESVWKSAPDFEYRIPDAFQPFARQVARRHYDGTPRICLDRCHAWWPHAELEPPKYGWSGFAVLPPGMCETDMWDLIDHTKDGRMCIDGWNHSDFFDRRIKCVQVHSSYLLNYLYELQSKTGDFSSDHHPQDSHKSKWLWRELLNTHALLSEESELLRYQRPTSFKGVVGCICGAHNAYAHHNDDDMEYSNAEAIYDLQQTVGFKKYPFFCREDVFEVLLKLGYSRKDAFDVSEIVRKGEACSSIYQSESLINYHIPRGLEIAVSKVCCLFPRAHVAQQAMQLLLLLRYQALYDKEYRDVVLRDCVSSS